MVICRRSVRYGGQDLELYAKLNWEPMKVLLNRSDVVDGGGLGYNLSSGFCS